MLIQLTKISIAEVGLESVEEAMLLHSSKLTNSASPRFSLSIKDSELKAILILINDQLQSG